MEPYLIAYTGNRPGAFLFFSVTALSFSDYDFLFICSLDQMSVPFSKSWEPRSILVPVVTGTISPFVGERRKFVIFMFTELFLFFKKKK